MEELTKPEFNYSADENESSNENGQDVGEKEVDYGSDSQSNDNSSYNSFVDDPELKEKRSRIPFIYMENRYINRRYRVYVREHPSYSFVEIAEKIHYELYNSPIPSDEVTVIRELIGWGREEGEEEEAKLNRGVGSVLHHIYNYRKKHRLVRRRGRKSQRRCS